MGQWKYRFVVSGYRENSRVKFIDGSAPEEAPFIHDYINDLGSQGWELVGFTDANTNGLWFVLKRPGAELG